MFNNVMEFTFEGVDYGYELDGYKPLGVYELESGELIEYGTEGHDEIYSAACRHATESMFGCR